MIFNRLLYINHKNKNKFLKLEKVVTTDKFENIENPKVITFK
jgi:hypothetical protein